MAESIPTHTHPETLVVDRDRPGVVVLQLNRPKQLNAINEAKSHLSQE